MNHWLWVLDSWFPEKPFDDDEYPCLDKSQHVDNLRTALAIAEEDLNIAPPETGDPSQLGQEAVIEYLEK